MQHGLTVIIIVMHETCQQMFAHNVEGFICRHPPPLHHHQSSPTLISNAAAPWLQ